MDIKGFLIQKQVGFARLRVRWGVASVALGSFCGHMFAHSAGAIKSESHFGGPQEIVVAKEDKVLEFGGGLDIEMDPKKFPRTTSKKNSGAASKKMKKKEAKKNPSRTSQKSSALQTYLDMNLKSSSGTSTKESSPLKQKSQTDALDAYFSQGATAEVSSSSPSKKEEGALLKEVLGVKDVPVAQPSESSQPQSVSAKPVRAVATPSVPRAVPAIAFLDLQEKKVARKPKTRGAVQSAAPKVTQTVTFLDLPKKPSKKGTSVQATVPSVQATPVMFLDMPQALPVASPKAASADRGPKRPIPPVPSSPSQVLVAPERTGPVKPPFAPTPEVILVTPIPESTDTASPKEKMKERSAPEMVVVGNTKISEPGAPEVTKVAFIPGKEGSDPSQKTASEILVGSSNVRDVLTVLTSTDAQPVAQNLPLPTSAQSEEPDTALRQTEAYKALPATVIETKSSPTLTLSGDICTYLGTVSQDDARDDHEGTMHLGMGWGNFGLNISGEANASVQYGYHGTLEVIPGASISMKDNYGEVITPYGVVQFGNTGGVETAFIEDSSALSNGTGAADGSYQDMFNMPVGVPNMVHLMGFTKKATKLSYYSPRWQGFQFGVSYCPNPHHVGWGSLGDTSYAGANSNDDAVFHSGDMKKRHNLALGLNYAQDFSDISVNASLVGLSENTKIKIDVPQLMYAENRNSAFIEYTVPREIQLRSTIAYQASGSISYKGFKLAGGWIDNGSLNLPNTAFDAEKLRKPGLWLGDAGKGWNLGGEYTFGCMVVSLAHNEIHRKVTPFETAQGKLNALGVEAQVIPGIKLFAEIMHIDAETTPRAAALYENSAPVKNKGTVVMIGSKVSF